MRGDREQQADRDAGDDELQRVAENPNIIIRATFICEHLRAHAGQYRLPAGATLVQR